MLFWISALSFIGSLMSVKHNWFVASVLFVVGCFYLYLSRASHKYDADIKHAAELHKIRNGEKPGKPEDSHKEWPL